MRNYEQQLLVWLPHLRRYARALHRNREDADDLVQDTLEKAWAKSSLWQGVGDMRAWLLSIMHNVHVDAIRRPRLMTKVVEAQEDSQEVSNAPAHEDRLVVRDLQAVLNLLPLEQKEVVLLVALENMSYAEVAITLDIPIGTVMSRLSRGRERLRLLMGAGDQTQRLKSIR